jgi:tRNA (guanine37-N1)-methyltransferase
MRFDVFTLFPSMFDSPFADSIVRRAIDAGLVELHAHNIRDHTTDKHHIADDYAYGGGGGMVMKPEPIFAAVESVLAPAVDSASAGPSHDGGEYAADVNTQSNIQNPKSKIPVILMSASGRTFTHRIAEELAQHPRIALVCGHYEGVDERVRERLCTDEISIGDYVLTGGELPAMVIIDAVSRLVPGVLPPGVPEEESHATGLLEYPHYTRPVEYRGWRVPDVLLSGNHAEIAKWRRAQAERRTRERRSGDCE